MCCARQLLIISSAECGFQSPLSVAVLCSEKQTERLLFKTKPHKPLFELYIQLGLTRLLRLRAAFDYLFASSTLPLSLSVSQRLYIRLSLCGVTFHRMIDKMLSYRREIALQGAL